MKNNLDQIFIRAIGQKLQSEAVEVLWQSIEELPLITNDNEALFYEFKQSGISCLFNGERILEAIHLFGEKREGFSNYIGALPEGVSFQNSKSEIIQKLGTPSLEGGGKPSILGGSIAIWIKYLHPNYQLHFQFDKVTQKITLITLMSPLKM